MSDTPTPDTDAEAMDGIDCYGEPLKSWDYKSSKDGEVVLAEFSRRLERERNAARIDLVAAEELHRRRFGTLKAEYDAACTRFAEAERERDEARREIKELKRAAIEVLKVVPVAYCCEMHHGKRDMHSALEPCPVVERCNAKIDKLRALLKEEA